MATERSGMWAAWVGFAGTMLMVIGSINIFQGVLALFADEQVVVVADDLVGIDLTGWGWILVLSGVLLIAVAAGLFLGAAWARVVGIVVVGLHAVTQVAWLGASPVWSLLMIALDTLVLFALTVRWSAARDDLDFYDGRSGYRSGTSADPLHGQLPHETAYNPPRLS